MGIVAFIERASKSISDMVGGSTKEATASGAEPREQQRTHDQTGRFVSPTKDKKRHRADNEIPQLQNRRISALKEGTAKRNRQAQNYREPSTSVETSPTGPLPVNASSQGSLGIGDGRIYIGPPIDIDRAKALYFPIEGPCRMHTVWLPSNLTVSQKEYARKKPAVEELEVKEESMYASARSDVNSDVTVDCEDKVSESVGVTGPTQELQQTAIKAEEGIDGEKGAEGQGTTVAPVPAADLPQVDAVPNLNKESHTEDNPPIVVESHGGYRSAIATHGIHRGAAVFEVKVESDVSQKNIFGLRLGWSTMSIELDRILHQPVGAIHSDGYVLGSCRASDKRFLTHLFPLTATRASNCSGTGSMSSTRNTAKGAYFSVCARGIKGRYQFVFDSPRAAPELLNDSHSRTRVS